MSTPQRVRRNGTTSLLVGLLGIATIGASIVSAPPAAADRGGDMVKCFIARGIVKDAAITVGGWQIGTPLIDPPGGIDRDNWFRTYAICSLIVNHRAP
jgi:hypothetical protein